MASLQKLVARVLIQILGPNSQVEYDPQLITAGGTRLIPTQVDVEGPVEYVIEEQAGPSQGNVFFFNPTGEDLADVQATVTFQHSTEYRATQAVDTIAGPGSPNPALAVGRDFWVVPPALPLNVAPNRVPYVPLTTELSGAGVITVDGVNLGRFIINETGLYRISPKLTVQSDAAEAVVRLGIVQDPDGAGGGTVFLQDQAGFIVTTGDPSGPQCHLAAEHIFPVDASNPAADRTYEIQTPYITLGTLTTGYPGQATPLAGGLVIERLA